MKQWLRRYLGIEDNYLMHENILAIQRKLGEMNQGLKKTYDNSIISRDASVRCLAILEPQFATPEDDTERKAASDELGEKIQTKLRGEDLARKHMTGEA